MKAMTLNRLGPFEAGCPPLELQEMPDPVPEENDLLVRVSACGVCHTELDEIEGRTPPPHLPVIPGHQVIGRVEATGRQVTSFRIGDRVGIGWIHSSCGRCSFCREGNENLCPDFRATGRDGHGGYAQYLTVPEDYACRIPEALSDLEAAPLLCAGAIGYRSLRLTGIRNGQPLGLTGFGASAHLVLRMVRHLYPETDIFVFARSEGEREFARELGAIWAGATEDIPPRKLRAIIDTTPAWLPVIKGLANLEAGGRLVINAIRKEESDKETFSRLDYPAHLWMEKEMKSVANVSRRDIAEVLTLAAEAGIRPEYQEFALHEANQALWEVKTRKIRGAKVLNIG